MSKFKVEVAKISKVWKHPNADRMDLAKVDGLSYQFCVQKGSCNVGDFVVYFPVDSVLPDRLVEHLGIRKILAGSQRNRVKTVTLRGQISQGLTVPIGAMREYLKFSMPVVKEWEEWDDLAKMLGVTKYEAPEVSCQFGTLVALPDKVPMYDIEGAQNYPRIIESLMDQKVCITEKLEGTNFSASLDRKGRFWVCQRSYAILPCRGWSMIVQCARRFLGFPVKEHDFWKFVNDNRIQQCMRKARNAMYPGRQLTMRGEMVGPSIQGNIYKLPRRMVFFFDAMIDEEYLPVDDFFELCRLMSLETVPVVSRSKTLREWLDGKDLQEASNGISQFTNVMREGVVIRPMVEAMDGQIGRLIIKQRSPQYLASTDF